MRVLFLCHRYADTTIGGLAEFLHYLPAELNGLGIQSIIYTRSKKDGKAHLDQPERLPNQIPHYSGPFLKPSLFIAQKELKPLMELCQREKIDLIHAQGTYRAGYMAMHLNKKLGIPYVVTSHSDISETNSVRIQRFNIKHRCKKVLKHSAFITHLSPIMAAISDKLYDSRQKSKIIHNGIDTADWSQFLNQPEQDYMLAIGRLEPEKGFPILIDAYAELVKRGITTSLVIAGTGSIEKTLQMEAKKKGLNVITEAKNLQSLPPATIAFTGYIRAADKKNLFSQAKLILFATQPKLFEEAFGIVQIEAMAARKALIASDMSITRYLQSFGMQATLVTPEKISTWTDAMQMLLADESKRLAMGEQNRELVQKFDWKLIAKEYADIYRSFLAKP